MENPNIDEYFNINPVISLDSSLEISEFIRRVDQVYLNRQIDQFSQNELIFLATCGVYPIESLNDWLEQSILKPGDYILPATYIKSKVFTPSS